MPATTQAWTDQQIVDALKRILYDELSRVASTDEISMDTTLCADLGAESLERVKLLQRIEDEFFVTELKTRDPRIEGLVSHRALNDASPRNDLTVGELYAALRELLPRN